VLAVWAIVGLVGGWLVHPIADRAGTAPVVSWLQPLALLFVAGILAYTAYSTHRIVRQRPDLLPPHQAVNRLVLARACALVGALVLGGYLGYALSWVGDDAELADERIWRSIAASFAGLLIVITALLLERACRVGSDDSAP
jgi:MFS family permease